MDKGQYINNWTLPIFQLIDSFSVLFLLLLFPPIRLGIEDNEKEQNELIDNVLLSPGYSTLEYTFSYPPPEHTWTELTIVKINDTIAAERDAEAALEH